MAQMTVAEANNQFLLRATERNYAMPNQIINQAGQVIDIELDSVPGYAHTIDLSCFVDLAVTAGATPTAPTVSPFAPWNIFSKIEVSLGGGSFQSINPFFYFLREYISELGAGPDYAEKSYSYASNVFNVPAPTVTASATTDTFWRFNIKIPLQVQYGSTLGMLPLGDAATKLKIRLTVSPSLYGVDQYQNALNGGTNITGVKIGSAQTSYVQPNIYYYTAPATGNPLPNPTIGMILNLIERSTPISTTGAYIPTKFPDPFRYLRLWHIIMQADGTPTTLNVSGFKLDLAPSYSQFDFSTPGALQSYYNKLRRQHAADLPLGVYLFDLFSGGGMGNTANGTQMIDGTVFSTLQTQTQLGSGFTLSGNGAGARIITFAEALSPVNF